MCQDFLDSYLLKYYFSSQNSRAQHIFGKYFIETDSKWGFLMSLDTGWFSSSETCSQHTAFAKENRFKK